MSYHIQHNPQHAIIYLSLSDSVTTDEVFEYNLEIEQLLKQSRQITHIVIDASRLKVFPSNLHHLRRLLTFLSHARLGWVIDWGNKVTNFYFINSVLNQLNNTMHYSCLTESEALNRVGTGSLTSHPVSHCQCT